MRSELRLEHRFVDCIPDVLEERVVYVAIEFATVVHRCCCGCGHEVVTPLSPTDWSLTFDGETISLDPSIGNWSFQCQSHYWIGRNRVRWAPRWSKGQIAAGRAHDSAVKRETLSRAAPSDNGTRGDGEKTLWQLLQGWWAGLMGRP